MTRTASRLPRPSRRTAGAGSKRTPVERSRTRRRAVGAAVAAAVLVAGASVVAVQRSAPADRLQAASATARDAGGAPAAVGEPFPDFALVTSDGTKATAADLTGSDTVLWFTTTYCVPCQVGAVRYRTLARGLGAKAPSTLFVFLDPQEPASALKKFRSEYGLPEWQMALDTDGLAQRAGVQVLDTKIFVDETGTVRDIDTAPVDDAYLADVRRLATA